MSSLALIAGLLLLAGMLIPAIAAAADGQADRVQVFKKLGVDDVGAHFVVLVDTSTSMGKEQRYQRVKAALKSFFATLSANDDLTVITFNARPSIVVYRQKGKQNPDAMIAQLPTKLGAKTDIGLALKSAVEQLGDLPASDVASLIVLTDGRQQAPAGSPFSSRNSPAWGALAAKARKLTESHEIQVYAMALTGDTDVGLVARTFPGAQTIALPQGQLASYFDDIKGKVRAAEAVALLSKDKSGVVQAQWPKDALAHVDLESGSASFDVVLKSTMPHVPVDVSHLRVTSTGELPMTFRVQPAKVAIPGGKGARVTIRASWTPPSEGGPHLSRTTIRTADLAMQGDVSTPWSQVITKDLGLTLPLRLQAGAAPLTAEGQTGYALWLVVLVFVVLGLLTLWAVRRFKSAPAPRLAGTYFIGRTGESMELHGVEHSLRDDARGGAVLWFGGTEGNEPRVALEGVQGDAFRLEARRQGRRGPSETWCVAESQIRVKLPDDTRPRVFDDAGPVPSGTEIQTRGNTIKL